MGIGKSRRYSGQQIFNRRTTLLVGQRFDELTAVPGVEKAARVHIVDAAVDQHEINLRRISDCSGSVVKLIVESRPRAVNFAIKSQRPRRCSPCRSDHSAGVGLDSFSDRDVLVFFEPALHQEPRFVLSFQALPPKNRIAEHDEVKVARCGSGCSLCLNRRRKSEYNDCENRDLEFGGRSYLHALHAILRKKVCDRQSHSVISIASGGR